MDWEIIVASLTISWFGMLGLAISDMTQRKATTGDIISTVL
jgi:hypothetical protein